MLEGWSCQAPGAAYVFKLCIWVHKARCLRRPTSNNWMLLLMIACFNFVEQQNDRFVKRSLSWSLGDDAGVAAQWRILLKKHGIAEWFQPHLTCETGIVLSRLDRIYSNLHVSHQLLDVTFSLAFQHTQIPSPALICFDNICPAPPLMDKI